MLKKGMILFHATKSGFIRIRGPAFFAPSLSLAREECPGKCRILVFALKKRIKTNEFKDNDFVAWMVAAYGIKKTKHQAYEHIRSFKNGRKYKEVVMRTPSRTLKFIGELTFGLEL